MSKLIDLTNKNFGDLTAIKIAGKRNTPNGCRKIIWECKCSCGKTVFVEGENLRNGNTKSCGCKRYVTGKDNLCFKNGYKTERLYRIWASMKQRCLNPNCSGYKNYGGRGIKICDEWLDYILFREWALSNGYDQNAQKRECTIDRIDVDGNYEPHNCRWVNWKSQMKNQRKTILITYNGITETRKWWAEKLGIYGQTLQKYLDKGHTMEEATAHYGKRQRKSSLSL